jgi:intergrase/recombinase
MTGAAEPVAIGYSTPRIAIMQAAIAEFFEPRRSVDAKKPVVVEWIKSQMIEAKIPDSANIAEAMFTIIKPEDHDPRKRRG